MVTQMLDHNTAELWDLMLYQQTKSMRFGDLRVADHPELSGKTTEEVRSSVGQVVLAIRRDGQFLFMPEPTEVVQAGDVLIVMGPNL